MSKRLVNLITLLIVIGLVFMAYRYFVVVPDEETEPAGVTVSGGEAEETSSAEFLDLLNSVKSLTLSKSLFSNLVFRDRLQDFSRPLPERSVGRGNPFAPFGQGGTTTSRLFGGSASVGALGATSTATSTAPKTTATSSAPAKPATSTSVQGNFNF